MKVIKPSFEILQIDSSEEILQRIERAGRTCYKSEDKITNDSAVAFVRMLIDKGHESVLEHEKITVLFICDRGVSHELVRHRIASFSQESTRYCNYSNSKFGNELTFILPPWLVDEQEFEVTAKEVYLAALERAEKDYLELIKLGWQPQQARCVLPNSLKTEIVVTANLREWRTILKQRTSAAAHPQMRELMLPLLSVLSCKLPAIFSDIQPPEVKVMFRATEKDCTGYLKGFPAEVVQKMLERMYEHLGRVDVNELKVSPLRCFVFDKTNEKYDFWREVAQGRNFSLFFEKYPQK